MGGLLRNYTSKKLYVRIGCNGLQFDDFEELPLTELPCKSELQWASLGGLLRISPNKMCHVRESGMQWAEVLPHSLRLSSENGLQQ